MSKAHGSSGPVTPAPGQFLRRPSLTQQIFLFFVIPLTALLLLAAFGSQTLHQQAMRAMVGAQDQRAAGLAAQAVETQLNLRSQALRLLMAQLADQAAPATVVSSAEVLAAEFDGGLAIFDTAGAQLAGQLPAPVSQSAALRALVAEAKPEPTFSIPITGTHHLGEQWLLVTATAPDGRVMVGASALTSLMDSALGDVLAPATGIVVHLIDAQRQTLYQSGLCTSMPLCTEHPGIGAAFEGHSGLVYIQMGTTEHALAFSPISTVQWALIIEEPWHVSNDPTLSATQYAPLVLLVPALVLALATLLFGVRQIVQPLQTLEKHAADLAWGKFDSITQPVGGIAEIRRLQAELVHLAQKVKTAQTSLHSYIGAITVGQEEERRRLARELHDDTLQALIALNQRLQAASLAHAEPATITMLAELQTLAGQTIADLRRFTRALRPIYLDDLGLVAALEALARETSQGNGLAVAFRQTGVEFRLAPQVELALYRLAQEALNNVAHHAHATQATLTLAFDLQSVTLTINDNGQGFTVPDNPAEFAASGHFGLLGMQERTELIGGQLQIIAHPNQGTQIVVLVKR